MLAERCYRNTLLTAGKSIDHALTMRGRTDRKGSKVPGAGLSGPGRRGLARHRAVQGNDPWPKVEPIVKTCLESTENPNVGLRLSTL